MGGHKDGAADGAESAAQLSLSDSGLKSSPGFTQVLSLHSHTAVRCKEQRWLLSNPPGASPKQHGLSGGVSET